MPAVSKKQQRFFGIVRSIQKGEQKPTTPETAKAASSMKMKSVKKFAKTKHNGLPEKKSIKEESCGKGEYYCYDDKKCKPIPEGMKVGKDGMLVQEAAFAIPAAASIASKVIPAAAATIGAVGTMMQARKKGKYQRKVMKGKVGDQQKINPKLLDAIRKKQKEINTVPSEKPNLDPKKNRITDYGEFQKTKPVDIKTRKRMNAPENQFEDIKTELLTKANERHKKAKSFKQFRRDSQKPLRKGEVRKYDPTSKSYKSNMSEVLEPISVPLKKIKKDLDNRKRVKDFQDRFRSPDRKLADEYEPELQEKSAAWQRKEGKNKSGGLNEKGRKSYERENPGSDLKAPQPEGGPRKRSFCARMGGVKGPMKKPDGSPTRKALALRKWKC